MNSKICNGESDLNKGGFNSKNPTSFLPYFLIFFLLFPVLLVKAQSPETFTTSGTWICPAGVTSITVESWGGGGAGGGVSTAGSARGGGGGGGGAYTKAINIPVTAGISYNVYIGLGGIGSTGNGTDGGDSYFNTNTTAFANGGNGGGANNGAGGIGGLGTNKGGNGYQGVSGTPGGGGSSGGTSTSGISSINNVGALAVTGGGAGGNGGATNSSDGKNGVSPGGGGGGARKGSLTAAANGGDGGNGQVIITYTKLTYKSQIVSMAYGTNSWCSGEARNVTVQIKNTGTATWSNINPPINIGLKWNIDSDYGAAPSYIARIPAGNLAPGATGTYIFQNVIPPAGATTENLTCDVVAELISWFANNNGGVGPGNLLSKSGTINVLAAPASPTSSVTQPTCTVATGTITITAPTGVGITYSKDGITYTSSAVFSGLATGSYNLTAKNSNGCISASTPVTVNAQPTVAAPTANVTQPTCAVAMGTITITAPTGAGITYSKDGITYTSSAVFSGLATGSYNLTAKNSSGCISASRPVTVNAQPTVAAPTATVTQPTCTVATGTITITAPTGAGITYSKDGITYTSSAVFSGLATGSYNLTAKNSSGCISANTLVTVNAQPVTPTFTFTTTPTCVGGASGTVTATASGGQTPYTFSLNGSTYQTSNLFTGLAAGTYTLSVQSNAGCIFSNTITISPFPNSTDDQTAAATDSWIGHAYSGMNFDNYIGNFKEAETFYEGFGGDNTCFTVYSNAIARTIFTDKFSVRFRMNSTKNGLYVADLGSDDGGRLFVDGALIFNDWSDHSFASRPRVLINLTGNSVLSYEYYENAGQNVASFQNLTLVLANTLNTNISQNICQGITGLAISGDSFGTLPTGISLSGTGYQWSYSTTPGGARINITGATSATYAPNSSIAPFNTAGTYYLYRNAILSSSNNTGVNPYAASNESNAAVLIVSVGPSATISYAGSPFCRTGSVNATRTGTAGGTFSSTPGLTISSTGTITLSSSTAGTYTVTYTVTAACTVYTTTTSIIIKANVGTPIFVAGPASSRCQAVESITYAASATNSTGISYSLDAASISAGNTINASSGAVTYIATWSGTSTITATAAGCSPLTATHVVTTSSTPSVTFTTTPTCIGGASGTILASTSGGVAPYTYSLNGSAYQASNLFTGLAAGSYTVSVKSNTGCIFSTLVVVSPYGNSTGDQTLAGSNSWIGHLYSGMNFQNYIGYFNETENFDEGFGGDYACFDVTSSSGISSIYTEQFSVRFKMNSTKKGLYVVDLGSDDGSRLNVDGTLVYNNWSDQSFSTRSNILINLNGNSSLNYEFYENAVNNRVIFNRLTLVLANSLSTNTNQSICIGNAGIAISGDSFGILPTGISLSGTGYQWSYSLTMGGARTDIAGATGATFTPNTLLAPFNSAGTYYVYRSARLSSSNNTNVNPYSAANESNAAVITVNAVPNATISYVGSPFCNTLNTGQAVTVTGSNGGTFTSSPAGLSLNVATGAVNPASSLLRSFTVFYTVPGAGGCNSFATSTDIYIGQPGTWFGKINTDWSNSANWICGQIPNSTISVFIPKSAPNYPTVISGSATVKDLTIQKDASVIINSTLKVAGDIINSGTLNASNGTLEMNGSSAQTIAGSMFDQKIIQNLIVSNTGAGLSVASILNDTLKITGSLSFGTVSSKLFTGDNINLVSSLNATANVGIVNPGNIITGKVIVDRFIPSGINHEKSWQLLASPTVGQTIKESWMENGIQTLNPTGYGLWLTGVTGTSGGFDAASPSPSMKTYVPATDTWLSVGNPSTSPIYNPNGYLVFVRGDRSVFNLSGANSDAQPTNLRTKGNLLTGTLPLINIPAGKYQSIGNPYASRIEFSKINMSNIDNVFYVWDPLLYGAYGYGGYQTLSGTNGYKPTVPSGGATANYQLGVSYPYIESGQAFFVHNSTATNGTVTFTESVKATGNRLVNRAGLALSERQFFRVYLYNNAGIVVDGSVVAFDNDFLNIIDKDDAVKMPNTGENFGIRRDGIILAVEARSPIENTDTIYYNIGSIRMQTYRLHFSPENMRGSGLSAFLVDNYLKSTREVSLYEDSEFDLIINSDAASYAADRLKVIFKPMAPLPVTFTSVNATQKNADILVEWKVENQSNLYQYEVEKSIDGSKFTKVATVKAINANANSYNWLDQNVVSGYNYYKIRSVDINGNQTYTQIVKVLIGKSISEITVYPNPVVNGTINLLLANQPAGIYQARLLNPLGQVIMLKNITHTEGSSTEIFRLNNSSAKGMYQLEITKPDGDKKIIKVLN